MDLWIIAAETRVFDKWVDLGDARARAKPVAGLICGLRRSLGGLVITETEKGADPRQQLG